MNIPTAQLPIEMLNHDDTAREEYIEARTTRAPVRQFNNIELAQEWMKDMKERFGVAAPEYKLYLVEKTTTRTLINV